MKLRKEKKRPYRTDHTLPSVPLYPSQQVLVIQVDFRYFLLQVLIKIILGNISYLWSDKCYAKWPQVDPMRHNDDKFK